MGMTLLLIGAGAEDVALYSRDTEQVFVEAARRWGEAARSPDLLDLHKTWHMFHYLLDGHGWTAVTDESGGGLFAGQPFGVDMGYGPPHLLSVEQTAHFARRLDALTVEQLADRVDMDAIRTHRIYVYGEGHVGRDETIADIKHYFPMLQAWVGAQAEKGNSIVLVLH